MILANFNADCNMAKNCFKRLASNLRHTGECRYKVNPETVAVSGFWMFVRETDYLLEFSACCLMPFVSCKIVYTVGYFIDYRGISLSTVK